MFNLLLVENISRGWQNYISHPALERYTWGGAKRWRVKLSICHRFMHLYIRVFIQIHVMHTSLNGVTIIKISSRPQPRFATASKIIQVIIVFLSKDFYGHYIFQVSSPTFRTCRPFYSHAYRHYYRWLSPWELPLASGMLTLLIAKGIRSTDRVTF